MRQTADFYNTEVERWHARTKKSGRLDDFVSYDDRKLKWSRDLKQDLERGSKARFSKSKIRPALYRPFTRCYLYFHRLFNEEVYQFPEYFPHSSAEAENRAIQVAVYGRKHFAVFMTDRISDLNFFADPAQCFPFYTYDGEDGSRRENIPSGTSSTTSMRCCITRSIVAATPPTSVANCCAFLWCAAKTRKSSTPMRR